MANYVKATNFFTKDALLTGNPDKIIKGAEIDAEYNAIATAVASKADTTSPTFTGTPIAPTASAGTNTTQIATTAFVVTAVGTSGTMASQNANAVAITGGTIAGVTVAGTFTGNVTGNLTGNVTGNTTGSSGSCTGNAATATTASNAIGVGQTWQNVSGSRSAGTTYTNSTGKSIMVSIRTQGNGYITVDGVVTAHSSIDNATNFVGTIVPPGSSYYMTGTVHYWAELR